MRNSPQCPGRSVMVECPPTEHLERLIREELGDPELPLVVAHVEGCAACQETLHDLAASAGPTPTHLVAALAEPALGSHADTEAFFQRLAERARAEGGQRPQVD